MTSGGRGTLTRKSSTGWNRSTCYMYLSSVCVCMWCVCMCACGVYVCMWCVCVHVVCVCMHVCMCEASCNVLTHTHTHSHNACSKPRNPCGGLGHSPSCCWLRTASGNTWSHSGTSTVRADTEIALVAVDSNMAGMCQRSQTSLPLSAGLGWNRDMSPESLGGASLLHWNGRSE